MAKHTNLLYGTTGSGKTDLLRTFAKGLFESTGKKTRLCSAEKAQSEGVLREGIEAGWIIPWWINDLRDAQGQVVTPFERMTDAVLGKWPLDPSDPQSPLVPAWSIDGWKAVCTNKEKHADGKDKLVYQGPQESRVAAQLICPLCKQAVIQYPNRSMTDKRLSEIGAYFMEGATEFSDMMMQNMAVRTAKLQAEGQQLQGAGVGGNIAISFKDGNLLVGGNNMGHYGTAQTQIKNRIGESAHLPVDYVWWTAVMESGEDDDKGKLLVFGPKIAGNAKTAVVPRWFGTTLSTCTKPIEGKGESEYRLYLKEYYQDWIPIVKMKKVLVDNRVPSGNLKGIPQFVVVDATKELLEVAGIKMKPETLLWQITQLIESRQAPKKDDRPSDGKVAVGGGVVIQNR